MGENNTIWCKANKEKNQSPQTLKKKKKNPHWEHSSTSVFFNSVLKFIFYISLFKYASAMRLKNKYRDLGKIMTMLF